MQYQIFSTISGCVIGLIIFILIRKNHLHSGYAVWWIITAVAVSLFGSFPTLIDQVGFLLGISYPPVLLIVLSVCIILLKILTMDIERTRQEQKIRRLVQRLALLEQSNTERNQEEQLG